MPAGPQAMLVLTILRHFSPAKGLSHANHGRLHVCTCLVINEFPEIGAKCMSVLSGDGLKMRI